MTANPNQHWGGRNHTSVSRFLTSIVVFNPSARESAKFIVGLPQLKDRYFRDISNVLMVKIRAEKHFRHTQPTEANLTAK